MEPVLPARDRVIAVASELLEQRGVEGVSTRVVAAAAGTQPPAIYRLFGDKEGLLRAVAETALRTYLLDKTRLARTDDPVADLRRAWDLHVDFGLAHPAFYTLVFARPLTGKTGEVGREATAILRELVARIADAGRLRVSVSRATQLVYASGVGVVLALLSEPVDERDLELSELARETALATIAVTDTAPAGSVDAPIRAIALRESLRKTDPSVPLSPAESALMSEWLDRIADRYGPHGRSAENG